MICSPAIYGVTMDIFKLLGTIAIDNTKANSAIDETAKKAESGGKKTDSAYKKIGESAWAFD